MTLWRTLALSALASMTIACSGDGKDTDTDTTDTTPDTPEPEDTVPTGSTLYDIEAIAVAAEFAYNATTDTVTQASIDGNTLDPLLTISLGTTDYFQSGDDDEGCPIFIANDGVPAERAQWAQGEGHGLLFGFEFTGQWTADSSACEGILDVAEVDAFIEGLIGSDWLWGLGLQEDLGADAADALAGADIEAIGGGFAGTWNAEDDITEISRDVYNPDGGYVQGVETDENGELQFDGSGNPIFLDADQMVIDGALQTGYYIYGEVFYYTLQ